MTRAIWAALTALLGLMGSSSAVVAANASLTLIVGGEAYDGPPKFDLTFNGTKLGEGSVAAAIDTVSVGRFADAGDKTAYVQSFEFTIPESVFQPDGDVRIRLTNEAYGGDGSNHDRNLYLASVAVNGRAVTASGLTTFSTKGIEPNTLLGEFLVLNDGNVEGVGAAPPGGWPAAPGAIADAEPAVPAVVAAAEVDPIVTNTAPAAAPMAAAVVETVQTASLDSDPEGNGKACGIDELYNVVGFNENSNDLTPKLIERLDQIAAEIGDRQCNVQITGYSSRQGSYATNALFAIERAQNALKYLQDKGVKFIRTSATGVGATDQFGTDFRANRRVVITVTP